MKTREFTKNDWVGFQGCEDESPRIGSSENGVTILDGTNLQFHPEPLFSEEQAEYFWMLELPNKAVARAVIEALPELMTLEALTEFGFKKQG